MEEYICTCVRRYAHVCMHGGHVHNRYVARSRACSCCVRFKRVRCVVALWSTDHWSMLANSKVWVCSLSCANDSRPGRWFVTLQSKSAPSQMTSNDSWQQSLAISLTHSLSQRTTWNKTVGLVSYTYMWTKVTAISVYIQFRGQTAFNGWLSKCLSA